MFSPNAPAPTLHLGPCSVAVPLAEGLNFITIPCVPPVDLTAEGLVSLVAGQGGALEQVDRWDEDTGQWDSFRTGFPFDNFPIEPGRAYFLLNGEATTVLFEGAAAGPTLDLAQGPEWAGVPGSTRTDGV